MAVWLIAVLSHLTDWHQNFLKSKTPILLNAANTIIMMCKWYVQQISHAISVSWKQISTVLLSGLVYGKIVFFNTFAFTAVIQQPTLVVQDSTATTPQYNAFYPKLWRLGRTANFSGTSTVENYLLKFFAQTSSLKVWEQNFFPSFVWNCPIPIILSSNP